MCGRFTREYTWKEVHNFLDLRFPEGIDKPEKAVESLDASYNVAPTQGSLAVRSEDGRIGLADWLVWGFTPGWMAKKDEGPGPINARAETVASNRMFKKSFEQRRCLLPISSFYEWQKIKGQRAKQPWRILRADGEIMLAAGIWTPSGADEDEEAGGTFAIITTDANGFMKKLHDRMPAILEPEEAATWCDPETGPGDARELLRPASNGVLDAHMVSTRVNSPKNNDPSIVEPVDEGEASLFG